MSACDRLNSAVFQICSFIVFNIFTWHASKNKYFCTIMLSILGLTIFELLFEARARYLFTYAPLYIILAVQGFSQWITIGRYSKKCSGEIEKVEQKQNENLGGSHEKLHSETVL